MVRWNTAYLYKELDKKRASNEALFFYLFSANKAGTYSNGALISIPEEIS